MASNKGDFDGFDFDDTSMEYFPLDGDFDDLDDPKSKGIKGFFRNAVRSVKNLTVDIASEMLPDAVSYATQAKDAVSEVVGKAAAKKDEMLDRSGGGTVDKIKKEISSAKQEGKEMLSGAKERIKKGKLYNGSSGADISFDFDGMDDFGDDDSSEESYEDPEEKARQNKGKITTQRGKGGAYIGAALASNKKGFGVLANKFENVTGSAARQSMQLQMGLYRKQAIMSAQNTAEITSVLKNIAHNTFQMTKFFAKEGAVDVASGLEYKAKSLAFLEDLTSLMKEMRGAQMKQLGILNEEEERALREAEESEKSTHERVFGKGFDFGEYLKNVGGNAKDILMGSPVGQMYSAYGMLKDMQGMTGKKTSPLGMLASLVSQSIPGMLLTDKTKTALGGLNDVIAGGVPAMIGKFNQMAQNKGGIMGTIGQLFGVDTYMEEKNKMGSSIDELKTATSFDKQTHKTINIVIPDLLASIESALTGHDEKVFDYTQGRFTTKKAIKASYEREEREAKASNVNFNKGVEFHNMVKDDLLKSGMFKLDKNDAKKYMDIFHDNILKSSLPFSPAALESDKAYQAEMFNGIDNPEMQGLLIEMASRAMDSDYLGQFNGAKFEVGAKMVGLSRERQENAKVSGGAVAAADYQHGKGLVNEKRHLASLEAKKKNLDPNSKTYKRDVQQLDAQILSIRDSLNYANEGVQGEVDTKGKGAVDATIVGAKANFATVNSGLQSIYNLLLHGIMVYPVTGSHAQRAVGRLNTVIGKTIKDQADKQVKEEEEQEARDAQEEELRKEKNEMRERAKAAKTHGAFTDDSFFGKIFRAIGGEAVNDKLAGGAEWLRNAISGFTGSGALAQDGGEYSDMRRQVFNDREASHINEMRDAAQQAQKDVSEKALSIGKWLSEKGGKESNSRFMKFVGPVLKTFGKAATAVGEKTDPDQIDNLARSTIQKMDDFAQSELMQKVTGWGRSAKAAVGKVVGGAKAKANQAADWIDEDGSMRKAGKGIINKAKTSASKFKTDMINTMGDKNNLVKAYGITPLEKKKIEEDIFSQSSFGFTEDISEACACIVYDENKLTEEERKEINNRKTELASEGGLPYFKIDKTNRKTIGQPGHRFAALQKFVHGGRRQEEHQRRMSEAKAGSKKTTAAHDARVKARMAELGGGHSGNAAVGSTGGGFYSDMGEGLGNVASGAGDIIASGGEAAGKTAAGVGQGIGGAAEGVLTGLGNMLGNMFGIPINAIAAVGHSQRENDGFAGFGKLTSAVGSIDSKLDTIISMKAASSGTGGEGLTKAQKKALEKMEKQKAKDAKKKSFGRRALGVGAKVAGGIGLLAMAPALAPVLGLGLGVKAVGSAIGHRIATRGIRKEKRMMKKQKYAAKMAQYRNKRAQMKADYEDQYKEHLLSSVSENFGYNCETKDTFLNMPKSEKNKIIKQFGYIYTKEDGVLFYNKKICDNILKDKGQEFAYGFSKEDEKKLDDMKPRGLIGSVLHGGKKFVGGVAAFGAKGLSKAGGLLFGKEKQLTLVERIEKAKSMGIDVKEFSHEEYEKLSEEEKHTMRFSVILVDGKVAYDGSNGEFFKLKEQTTGLIPGLAGLVWKGAKTVGGGILGAAPGLLKGAWNFGKGALGVGKKIIGGTLGLAGKAIKGVGGALGAIGSKIFGGFGGGGLGDYGKIIASNVMAIRVMLERQFGPVNMDAINADLDAAKGPSLGAKIKDSFSDFTGSAKEMFADAKGAIGAKINQGKSMKTIIGKISRNEELTDEEMKLLNDNPALMKMASLTDAAKDTKEFKQAQLAERGGVKGFFGTAKGKAAALGGRIKGFFKRGSSDEGGIDKADGLSVDEQRQAKEDEIAKDQAIRTVVALEAIAANTAEGNELEKAGLKQDKELSANEVAAAGKGGGGSGGSMKENWKNFGGKVAAGAATGVGLAAVAGIGMTAYKGAQAIKEKIRAVKAGEESVGGAIMGSEGNYNEKGERINTSGYDSEGNYQAGNASKMGFKQAGLKHAITGAGGMKALASIAKKTLSFGAKKGNKLAAAAVKVGSKASGLLSKFIGLLKKLLDRVLSNPKIAKKLGKGAGDGIIKTFIKELNKNLAKQLAKIGGKIGAKLGAMTNPVGWAILVAQLLADFGIGMANANRYFKLPKGIKPTGGQRVTSGLVNMLSGLAFGLIPVEFLVNLIWKFVGDENTKVEQQKGRDFGAKRAQLLGVDADRLTEFETKSIFDGAGKSANVLGFGKDVALFKEWKEKKYTPSMDKFKEMKKQYKMNYKCDVEKVQAEEDMKQYVQTFRDDYISWLSDFIKSNKLEWLKPGFKKEDKNAAEAAEAGVSEEDLNEEKEEDAKELGEGASAVASGGAEVTPPAKPAAETKPVQAAVAATTTTAAVAAVTTSAASTASQSSTTVQSPSASTARAAASTAATATAAGSSSTQSSSVDEATRKKEYTEVLKREYADDAFIKDLLGNYVTTTQGYQKSEFKNKNIPDECLEQLSTGNWRVNAGKFKAYMKQVLDYLKNVPNVSADQLKSNATNYTQLINWAGLHQQEQDRQAAAATAAAGDPGKQAELRNTALGILDELGLTEEQKKYARFQITNGNWKLSKSGSDVYAINENGTKFKIWASTAYIKAGLAADANAQEGSEQPQAMAKGGVITGRRFAEGGIVDQPTAFSFGNGKKGLMGEAGAEAIMPLKRGAGGKLGVSLAGTDTPMIKLLHSIQESNRFQQMKDEAVLGIQYGKEFLSKLGIDSKAAGIGAKAEQYWKTARNKTIDMLEQNKAWKKQRNEKIKSGIGGAFNAIKEKAGAAANWIDEKVGGDKDNRNALGKTIDKGKQIAGKMKEGIKNFLSNPGGALSSAGSSIAAAGGKIIGAIKNAPAALSAFLTNRTAVQNEVQGLMQQGEQGITPLVSLAKAIRTGDDGKQLTDTGSLQPEFRKRVEAFLADPRLEGKGVSIREAKRTPLTQLYYYSRGRAPDAIVDAIGKTAGGIFNAGSKFWGGSGNRPGSHSTWTLASNHFSGTAVDLNNGQMSYNELGKIAKEYGIDWGGNWSSPDPPHFELDVNAKYDPSSHAQKITEGAMQRADGIGPGGIHALKDKLKVGKAKVSGKISSVMKNLSSASMPKISLAGGSMGRLSQSPVASNSNQMSAIIQEGLSIMNDIHKEQKRHNEISEGYYKTNNEVLMQVVKMLMESNQNTGQTASILTGKDKDMKKAARNQSAMTSMQSYGPGEMKTDGVYDALANT